MLNEIESRISAIREIINKPNSILAEDIERLAKTVLKTFKNGNKIAFVGNGGSAAEASHLAAEFTGKCVVDHKPVPAICLNESQSALTAVANDYGVTHIFERQVQAHLRRGDILIALTTSGKSENILNAFEAAKTIGVNCFAWTGVVENKISGIEYWEVPSKSTPRIQEVHLMWGHILAEVVELNL